MPNASKRARAFLKDYLAEFPEPGYPEVVFSREGGADLTVRDLRALLRSEREARAAAAHLRTKNETYVQRLKDLQRLHEAALSAISRRARDAAALRDRAQKAEEELARANQALRNLRSFKVLPEDYQALRDANEEQAKEIRALREEVRIASRKDTPPPGGLSAEDLRKVAEDLLPQFLATFLPPPRDKK